MGDLLIAGLTALMICGGIITFMAVMFNNRVYCWWAQNSEWKLWKKILEHYDEISFVEHNYFGEHVTYNNYVFCLRLGEKRYEIKLWEKDEPHTMVTEIDGPAYLCGFDKYHSVKLAERLTRKFNLPLEVKRHKCAWRSD